MGKRILVIAAGHHPLGETAPDGPFDLVIAADGGLERAQALGIEVDVVVGDLDSATPGGLTRAKDDGVEVVAHPAEKDHTDLELALKRALEEQPDHIRVLGVSGGRPDHWLTNLALLGAAAHAGPSIDAETDGWTVSVVVPERAYLADALAGELVSLVPVGGDALGVATAGLRYPLDNEDLAWGGSRGVSNVTAGASFRVDIRVGTLLVFRSPASPPTTLIEGATR